MQFPTFPQGLSLLVLYIDDLRAELLLPLFAAGSKSLFSGHQIVSVYPVSQRLAGMCTSSLRSAILVLAP